MALMISLKPGEQVMLNGAMIENPSDGKIRIQLNNQVRMLRQRDYLPPSNDLSPAETVYVAAMLLSGGAAEASLSSLAESVAAYRALNATSPGEPLNTTAALENVMALAADGEFYLAMVEARALIALENPSHPILPLKAGGSQVSHPT